MHAAMVNAVANHSYQVDCVYNAVYIIITAFLSASLLQALHLACWPWFNTDICNKAKN